MEHSAFFPRLASALVLLLLCWAVAPPPAQAEIALPDVAFDSELRLLEIGHFGSYARYSIRMQARGSSVEMALDRDGRRVTLTLPVDEYLRLWHRLLDNGLERIDDAPREPVLPDQGSFEIEFRVGGLERSFSAQGVDSLSDRRYRAIVREILAVADAYLESSAGAR